MSSHHPQRVSEPSYLKPSTQPCHGWPGTARWYHSNGPDFTSNASPYRRNMVRIEPRGEAPAAGTRHGAFDPRRVASLGSTKNYQMERLDRRIMHLVKSGSSRRGSKKFLRGIRLLPRWSHANNAEQGDLLWIQLGSHRIRSHLLDYPIRVSDARRWVLRIHSKACL